MGDLIVVSGPPGAGKSSVASVLVEMFDPSALVEGDTFFAFLRQGFVPPWLTDSKQQNKVLLDAAAAAAGHLSLGGYTVVYDGVLGPWFLAAFTSRSGVARLHYVLLLPPETTCVERVRSRLHHGLSDVEATRQMHSDFVQASIDPRHVTETSGSPAQVASRVRDALSSGRFLVGDT